MRHHCEAANLLLLRKKWMEEGHPISQTGCSVRAERRGLASLQPLAARQRTVGTMSDDRGIDTTQTGERLYPHCSGPTTHE